MRCTSLMLLGLFAAGCGRSSPGPVDPTNATGVSLDNYVIGQPLRFQNLEVFPVSSRQAHGEDRFITLDEGLKAGTVEVREKGAGTNAANAAPNDANPPAPANDAVNPAGQQPAEPLEAPAPGGADQQAEPQVLQAQPQGQVPEQPAGSATVNELVVINRSGKPLYLMPGEVILGGQQDRTVGEETIIAATGKPIPVKVFCVEQGRWSQRDVARNVEYLRTIQAGEEQKLSDAELKKLAIAANQGQFVKGAGNAGKDVRLAIQGAMDQGKVWEQVAACNSKTGAMSGSGAFTSNYGEKEIAEKLNPYIDAMKDKIVVGENVVGVIVAVNGKVQSIDLFESTPLFKKLWPKLLKSYALDALGDRDEKKAAPTCTLTAAADFLKGAMAAKVEKKDTNGTLCVTRRETDKAAYFSADFEKSPAACPVHTSVLAK